MKNIEIKNLEFIEQLKGFKTRLTQQGRPVFTVNSIESNIKEFMYFLSGIEVESTAQITQARIDKYFSYLSTRKNTRRGGGLANSYINKQRESVLRFMEYLTESKLGKSGFVVPHLKPEIKEKDILSKEEMEVLFNSCDGTLVGITNKCMLALLYGCGMRKNELYSLEINDIDLSKGLIRLDNTKTRQERDIVMTTRIQQIVEEYIYSARNMMLPIESNATHVIVTERGQRMGKETITWRVREMASRAGIEKRVTPHLFRHSIATHLMDDLSLEEIAEFLGHKCIDSTQIYTKIKGGTI